MTRRILGVLLAVCALAVTVFFVPMALLAREQYQRTDLLELQRISLQAVRTIPTDLDDLAQWQPPADAEPDHEYAIYDVSGRRLTGRGPQVADAPVIDAFAGNVEGRIGDDQIIAATPLGPGSAPIAVLRVAESRGESTARTATVIAGMAGLALLAFVFAAAAGWWLVRRLFTPVNALRVAAERVGEGDFTVAVPATDLPEIDAVGKALASSADRISRLLERERAFSADASHQLRTPLAGVILALETELLAPRPDRRTVIRESIDTLLDLEVIVENLLALARDDTNPHHPVNLDALLEEQRQTWAPRYRSAGRSLEVRAGNDVEVMTSVVAVRHILDVLLDNALKHGAGTVRLATSDTPGGAVVTVTDEGSGPPHLTSLFQRRQPGASGTGIGLALARSLAEAEGARLTLRSTPPTTFELLLPKLDPRRDG